MILRRRRGERNTTSTSTEKRRRAPPYARSSSSRTFLLIPSLLLILLLLLLSAASSSVSGSLITTSQVSSSTTSSSTSTTQRSVAQKVARGGGGGGGPVVAAAAASSSSSTNNNQAWLNGLKNAAASSSAAACCKTLLQPIDAIKTIQQYEHGSTSSGRSGLSVVAACRELLARKGGITNFYAGLGVTVLGSIPSVGLYFGVYSYCKQRLLSTEYGQQHPTTSIALSAAIGNTVASFSRVPYEVIKQKLQTGQYTSTWAVLKELASAPAASAATALLFPKGGVWTQMIRDVPYAVVTLLLYEHLQQRFTTTTTTTTAAASPIIKKKNTAKDFVIGGIAGGLGSWVTNPADVLKTRLQTNSELYQGSVTKCLAELWKEGGPATFLRGSVPRLMHKVPANAFFFWFYEFFKRVLHVQEGGATGTTTAVVASKKKKKK